MARVAHRGRVVIRRRFAADVARMVMPAFGAYPGSINVRDALFADVFDWLNFTTHMLGAKSALSLRRQVAVFATNPASTPRWRTNR